MLGRDISLIGQSTSVNNVLSRLSHPCLVTLIYHSSLFTLVIIISVIFFSWYKPNILFCRIQRQNTYCTIGTAKRADLGTRHNIKLRLKARALCLTCAKISLSRLLIDAVCIYSGFFLASVEANVV